MIIFEVMLNLEILYFVKSIVTILQITILYNILLINIFTYGGLIDII